MSDVFWAAFGGSVAAGFITLVAVLTAEWFRWYLDRPLANVDVNLGFLVCSGSIDKTRQVLLEARNPHSKPVTLSTFGLSFKQDKWGTLLLNPQAGYQFPYQLEGGKSIHQWTTVQSLLDAIRKEGRTPADIKWV